MAAGSSSLFPSVDAPLDDGQVTLRPGRRHFMWLLALAVVTLIAACSKPTDVDLMANARKDVAAGKYADAKISLMGLLQANENHGEARLLLGRILLDTGDPAGAATEFRKAIGMYAEEAIPLLARALIINGNSEELITTFSDLSVKEPRGQAMVKTALSIAYSNKGDLAKANEQIQAAMAADPTFAPAKVILGRWKFAAGNYDEALKIVTEVIATNPREYDAWVLHGEIHQFGRRDLRTATSSYQTALEMGPYGAVAHSYLIDMALAADQEAEAKKRILAMSKLLPGALITVYYQAWMAMVDNNLTAAREKIQVVLRATDKNAKAQALAGTIAMRMGNLTEARDALAKAVFLDPTSSAVRMRLSETYLLLGELGQAMETLKPLLAQPKPPQQVLALEADIRVKTGSIRDSIEFFNKAAQSRPDERSYKIGLAHLKAMQGDVDVALKDLEALSVAGPQDNWAEMVMANVKLKRNDSKGALAALERAAAKRPDDPVPLLMRGEVLARAGAHDEARGAFDQAKAMIPTSVGPILALCELDASQGNMQAAIRRLQEWVEANPRHARARLALAHWHQRAGAKPEVVLKMINAAIDAVPGDPGPQVALIRFQLAAKDVNGALASALKATAAAPGNADLLAVLADAQLATGDAPAAVRTLGTLVGIRPGQAAAHLALGKVVMMTDDKQGSRQHFEKALAINPDLLDAHQGIIESHMRSGQWDEALAHCDRVQKLLPKASHGWQWKGDTFMARKQWAAAVEAYRSALDRGATTLLAIRLHDALVQSGKMVEAAKHATEWRAKSGGDPRFIEHLGTSALKRKEYSVAEAHFKDVLAKEPGSVIALNNMAVSLCKQGKVDGVSFAERADKLAPMNAAILDSWAECLAAAGDFAKAINLQRQALELEPKSPLLNFHLAKIGFQSGNKQLAQSQLQKLGELNIRYVQDPEVEALAKQLR